MNNIPLTKVMVVEDEADIRAIVKLSLEKIGNYTVRYCSSGKEALASFGEFSPQLVLLDVMMPEMDGMMTLKKLKDLPEFHHTVVVFMTAKVQPSEIKSYLELGAAEVIEKPFNPRLLADNLQQIWVSRSDKAYG